MMKVICFHNPEEINGYLSNWFFADFCVGDIRFSSMELGGAWCGKED